MKYAKEERLEVSRKIYESGLSNLKAGEVFGISENRNEIDEYIKFFNEERPAYSLNYLTPKQFRETYMQVQKKI